MSSDQGRSTANSSVGSETSLTMQTAVMFLVLMSTLGAIAVSLCASLVGPSQGLFLGFTPMLGAAGGLGMILSLATGLTLVFAFGCLRIFGTPAQGRVRFALLMLAFWPSACLWCDAIPELVSRLTPASSMARTVEITAVFAPDADEPQCLQHYQFRNAAGLTQHICSETEATLKPGAKVQVTERRNFFGIAITRFAAAM